MSKWSRLFLILVLALLMGCQSANNNANDDETAVETVAEPTATPEPTDPLMGTWLLVSWQMEQVAGEVNEPFGPEPLGQIMYDGAGNISAHVVLPDREPFASDVFGDFQPDEAIYGLATYIAYFGTYEIDEAEGIVTHTITASTYPNWTGTEQVRSFELSGNQLTLRSTEPMPGPGGGVYQILVWQRAEALP